MFARKVENHQEDAFVDLDSAREYADFAQRSTMRFRAFLSNLKTLNIQGRYLDVGAGAGNLAAIIASDSPEVEITALEISPNMVAIGEEYIESRGLQDQVKFVLGDAVDQDRVKQLGKYDLIYSSFSLHHWKDPRKAIDNLMLNLKENGVLYIYDLRRVWWLYWIPIYNGFLDSIRAAYIRPEIKELLNGIRPECYEINYEFPFMQSIIIRNTD